MYQDVVSHMADFLDQPLLKTLIDISDETEAYLKRLGDYMKTLNAEVQRKPTPQKQAKLDAYVQLVQCLAESQMKTMQWLMNYARLQYQMKLANGIEVVSSVALKDLKQ